MTSPHLPTSPHIPPASSHISPGATTSMSTTGTAGQTPQPSGARLPIGRRGQPRSAEISEAIRDLPVTGALLQGLVCRVKDNGESLRLLCWRLDLAEIQQGLDAVRCCPSLHPRDRREIAERSPRDHRTSAAPRPHLSCTSAAPRLHLVRTSAASRPHLGCISPGATRGAATHGPSRRRCRAGQGFQSGSRRRCNGLSAACQCRLAAADERSSRAGRTSAIFHALLFRSLRFSSAGTRAHFVREKRRQITSGSVPGHSHYVPEII